MLTDDGARRVAGHARRLLMVLLLLLMVVLLVVAKLELLELLAARQLAATVCLLLTSGGHLLLVVVELAAVARLLLLMLLTVRLLIGRGSRGRLLVAEMEAHEVIEPGRRVGRLDGRLWNMLRLRQQQRRPGARRLAGQAARPARPLIGRHLLLGGRPDGGRGARLEVLQ